ncbi:radical SAM protein [Phytohabitans sp. ZYX-F-186]|uniref:Radical SAM protein n=1 Tax=Phytohabitans maris TaxID=3071409 RepID=A0ABU0ZFX8_9ACTN|nr:radical SAM protein [Phytohabitans sp. ZYX-F-186]MDQ7905969.1 radical SAM protein [Phytohabitans sp. ZYX-F-186]
MTMLGMPAVPAAPTPRSAGPIAFTAGHHFTVTSTATVDELAEAATVPLSVILQITKRCNFDCSFCSETLQLPDPTLAELDTIRANLTGTSRVFLSGGEPLLRKDFGDIVGMYAGQFIVGIPTNATRGLEHAGAMVGKVAFVNVGLEGPRATTNRVRGDYDQVIAGIRAFLDAGLPLSLSAVVYRSTLHALPFTYQIADVIGAGKLKLILPLRKGNALDLAEHEFISLEEAGQTFERLTEARAVHDWRPALRMTTWTEQTEGHMILVEVTGRASAWPVYDAPDLLEPLGNLLTEPITEIWRRYRFKRNHFAKYLGASIRTVGNADTRAGLGGHARA